MNNICFFGLLHIKYKENRRLNFKTKDEETKIIIYLKNAILLDKQLKKVGFNFVLLTNKKEYLEKNLKKLNYRIKIKNLNFNTFVPKNTHFYSCHFRVDIFKYLSKLKKTYSILIDLDVLILNRLDVLKKLKPSDAFVNDITDNVVPAYGSKNILKYLNILNNNFKKFRWYGGDFFAGTHRFYKILYNKTFYYQKIFVKNIDRLKNQTDELFISASLNEIKNKKLFKFNKSAKLKIFTRYWNTNVKHKQKDISFYRNFKILHVPADKIFLSNFLKNFDHISDTKIEYFNYIQSYQVFVKNKFSKFLPQKIKNLIKYAQI